MSRRNQVMVGVLLASLLVLAACGGTSTGSGNGTPQGSGATATSTAKPKPTGVPKLTLAYCTGLMTVAESNQLMSPPIAVNNIVVDTGSAGGSCNYEYAQFKIVVALLFEAFPSGTSLSTIASAAYAQISSKGIKVQTTDVSGIGDQAIYVNASGVVGGITITLDSLATTLGPVYLSCFNDYYNVSAPANIQSMLTAVCKQVVSRM